MKKLKLDFNKREILNGYFVQALNQTSFADEEECKDFSERIFVGFNGGLAYKLFFGNQLNLRLNLSAKVRLDSFDNVVSVNSFFEDLKQYIGDMQGVARAYDLDLVSIDDKSVITPAKLDSDYIYNFSLGSPNIENLDVFRSFMKMANYTFYEKKPELSSIMEKLNQLPQ
ncbi:hypothetical protein HOK68_05130 [Candidatus Woesearchaeota archaeon]|jgi:hypothetical protein|nr:hypothetical protein [Candidatus Woesearchaeota archaeon]MBT4387054.1 hypothetical protein [Candidatus Woesearchaeota archaeon]MBT4596189.1 hypothetical protein [Candidatus Woesearchaeota archaeon]MBT5741588.1 hypothetical protein [Candidatus Woesearchaeota archaeon]MBT6506132.1 hypothetical protein [Candidatus Woesearchaeota archaeon]